MWVTILKIKKEKLGSTHQSNPEVMQKLALLVSGETVGFLYSNCFVRSLT